jgi:hypothetical protein
LVPFQSFANADAKLGGKLHAMIIIKIEIATKKKHPILKAKGSLEIQFILGAESQKINRQRCLITLFLTSLMSYLKHKQLRFMVKP